MLKWFFLITPLGLTLCELFFKLSQNFAASEQVLVIFMAIWMVCWWILGIAPLGITALIPLVYLPLLQIMPLKAITSHYSDPMIFLFLGGFMIGKSLEKTELSERFALNVLRFTGRSDKGVVIGFIISTALLSMWISNTATAIMMLPIAQSVLKFIRNNTEHTEEDISHLSTVIYLSIAYAANIGGTITPIGTPPNVVLMGYLDNLYQLKIDFWRWVAIMLPTSIILLAIQYFLLNKLFKYKLPITKEFRIFVKDKVSGLNPFNRSQKAALIIFSISCLLWIFKDLINYLFDAKILNDTTIAVLGGCLLYFIPYEVKSFKRVLDEKDISTLPWNILLLFGGGMALASVLEKFGLIELMINEFNQMPEISPYLLVLLVAVITLVLTEVMSNVALCMVALPILMGLGKAKGIDPLIIGIPATICASYAFSLPISTPPNAIVFGTNEIKMKDMLKAGILMNIIGIASVMSIGWILIKAIL